MLDLEMQVAVILLKLSCQYSVFSWDPAVCGSLCKSYHALICFVADYPDYAAANYEEGNYEDAAVKYEQDDDRYREGEEENEANGRNYNNEYEGEDY